MCDISHTEINNIESGNRIKPAIVNLKAFEKYLGFRKIVKLVGYSDKIIKYTDDSINKMLSSLINEHNNKNISM